jgi:hypothetical protein
MPNSADVAHHSLQNVASMHYDRYDYLAEKCEAIDIWEEFMKRVIAGQKISLVLLKKQA